MGRCVSISGRSGGLFARRRGWSVGCARRCGGFGGFRGGFSFIELVVVLAIIGVMAVVAVPRFSQANGRYESEMGARRLAEDLRRAQQTARATSRPWRVVVSGDGSGWEVEAAPVVVSGDPTLKGGEEVTGSAEALSMGGAEVSEGGEVAKGSLQAEISSGVVGRGSVRLRTGGVLVDGSTAVTVVSRTLVFDAYGLPDRGVVFGVRVGSHLAEVEVRVSGEIVVER